MNRRSFFSSLVGIVFGAASGIALAEEGTKATVGYALPDQDWSKMAQEFYRKHGIKNTYFRVVPTSELARRAIIKREELFLPDRYCPACNNRIKLTTGDCGCPKHFTQKESHKPND